MKDGLNLPRQNILLSQSSERSRLIHQNKRVSPGEERSLQVRLNVLHVFHLLLFVTAAGQLVRMRTDTLALHCYLRTIFMSDSRE